MSEEIILDDETRKVVCIVGTGYNWQYCPWGQEGWEYWGLNNMHDAQDPSVFTRWFQMHIPYSNEGHIDDEAHRAFCKEWDKPCYVQKEEFGKELKLKHPVVYPIDEVLEKFCPKRENDSPNPYFTNSVDYMICLAILEGFDEIRLYGVEFVSAQDDEYFKMRQSVEYYLGQALARGINVVIPDHSALLKGHYWYGYEKLPVDGFLQIMEENLRKVREDHATMKDEIKNKEKQLDTWNGAIQTLEQLIQVSKLRLKGVQLGKTA